MNNRYYDTNRFLLCSVFLIFAWTLPVEVFGQGIHNYYSTSISGPTAVCPDGTTQYTYAGEISDLVWSISGGYFVGSNIGLSVDVIWTQTVGTISASYTEEICWYDPQTWPPVLVCDYNHYDSGPLAVGGFVAQNVGGGGLVCAVDPVDLVVTLSESTPTCTYQLYRNGSIPVGSPQQGNIGALTWSGISTVGSYTVVSSCPTGVCTNIQGGAVVTQIAGSVGGTVSGSGNHYGSVSGFSLVLSGHTGTVVRWEFSTGGDWTPITSTQTTLVYAPTVTQTTSFRAVVRNGTYACMVAYSAPATKTIFPFAPTIASGTGLSSGSFVANWYPVSGATSYLLDVSTSSGFGTLLSGYSNLSCSGTSQVVSGLNGGTTYFYRVQAVNAVGPSNESNYTQVSTPTLGPPNILAATNIKSDRFTANWSTVSNATSYRLDVSTSPTFSSYVSGYQNKTVSGTSDVVSGLTAKTTYYLRVRSMSGSSPSANSVVYLGANLDRNFIKSTAIQKSGITAENQIDPLSVQDRSVTMGFHDGLGRSTQQVSFKQSPAQSDMIQAVSYDEFGREAIKYLPFVSGTDGWMKPDFLPVDHANYATSSNPQYQFYQNTTKVATTTKPFSKANLEASPLSRLIEQGAPGLEWQPDATVSYASTDRTVKHDYPFNGANEVLLWTYTAPSATYPLGMVSAGASTSLQYYAANTLRKNKTKDEQLNEVIEYVDKSGKTLLKRVQAGASTTINDTNYASTYYIYDDLGQLVYVVPPEATKQLSSFHDASATSKNNFMSRWAFRYKYDGRRRMVIKQVPGADSVRMVYDALDRLVLTQDGNQRLSNKWSYTKYDQLNRPIITGIYTHGSPMIQSAMASQLSTSLFHEKYNGVAATEGYTNTFFPMTGTLPLTVTYYDNYAFRSLWTGTWTYLNETLKDTTNSVVTPQPTTDFLWVNGQVTGTKVRVLDGGATNTFTWLKSVSYYDARKQLIQSLSDNYKGGTDRITNIVDFTGKVLKSKATHVEQDVTWKDLVGTTLVGNKLDRTQSGSAWNAGAVSTTVLAASQAGWVEFTVNEITSNRVIGLSSTNADAGYSTMNYALNLNGSTLTAYESNTPTAIAGAIVVGDVLRIERAGTTITYKKNGTVVRTSPTASSSMLMVDVSIKDYGKTITDVRASFASSTRIITRKFEYDHAGRLTRVRHQHQLLPGGSAPKIYILANEYNEMGQLVDKRLHSTDGTTYKQSVDYRYNIRGWLESINNSSLAVNSSNDETNDLFGMELRYNVQDPDLANSQFYNGNISGVKWSNYPGTGPTREKGYVYDYDPMNRIKSSAFRLKTLVNGVTSWNTQGNNAFAETGFNYDLNGNLSTLIRNDGRASSTMDNLSYNYGSGGGNRLKKVTDSGDPFAGFIDGANAANEYTYDSAGNMVGDLNKSITITYNHLNLPEVVKRGNDTLRYVYDASGRKLWQGAIFDRGVKATDYAGEFIYENDALQFVNHEEGRIVIASNTQVYKNPAQYTDDFTAVNATLATVTQNGAENYVRVTSNGTTARTGVFPISPGGQPFSVVAGEQYRIRVKAYRTGSSPAYIQVKAGGADVVWPGASIAASAGSESWSEQLVIIPAGATTLQVGVNWNTVTANEILYVNEVEITKLATAAPEYQYHLKDHLGNVRTTFTSKAPTTTSYTTNFESGSSPDFLNYTRTPFDLVDHTDAGGTTYSYVQLLNGGVNGRTGVARTFAVMPGDEVTISAYCKYMNLSTTNNPSAFITSLAAAFGVSAGSTGEQLKVFNNLNAFVGQVSGGAWGRDAQSVPMAFATILFFDKDYNFVDATWDRVTTTGAQTSGSVKQPPHDLVGVTAKAPAAGYAYVFLSNEHPTYVDVYFDDVTASVTPSMVVQVEDYYPFGLVSGSYQRETSLQQNYKYNGKEFQDESSIGWLDYGMRMYQPEIARWNRPDRLSEAYNAASPYHYAGNNPIRFVDINGDYFTGDTHHVDRLKSEAKDGVEKTAAAIKSLVEAIDNGCVNPSDLNSTVDAINAAAEKNTEFSNTVSEISELENSDQEYNILGSSLPGGKTTWNNDSRAVSVRTNGDIGITAHELKHAYLFETGATSLGALPGNIGRGYGMYDITDEISAYQRQKLFDPNNLPTPLEDGISSSNVRKIKDDDNAFAYKNLPEIQIPHWANKGVMYQDMADRYGHAFRANGVTYYPNKKSK